MAAPMAKIKQIFKVEKLNLQLKETIKSLLHLIKLNDNYTYWYYLSHREYNNCQHNIPQQYMLIPPCWFEKHTSETEEQYSYITRNFIGQEKVNRGHAYLIKNKRTSHGGPTGDERENR